VKGCEKVMTGNSFFSKLKSGLLGETADKLVKKAFLPLQDTQPKLSADVEAFILTGSPAGVLTQLASAGNQKVRRALELSPAANSYWYFEAANCRAARAGLYRAFAAGDIDAEVIVRLGKVMVELIGADLDKHTADDFPGYLFALLTDWLVVSDSRPYRNKGEKITMPPLEYGLLKQLAEKDDHHEAVWLSYYLDRKTASGQYGFDQFCKPLTKSVDIGQVIATHKDYFLSSIFPSLYSYGKANALARLDEFKLTDKFQELFIDQLVSDNKSVRITAEKVIDKLPRQLLIEKLQAYLLDGKSQQRKYAAQIIGRQLGAEGKELLEKALKQESTQSVISELNIALGASSMQDEAEEQNNDELPDYIKPDLGAKVSEDCVEIIYKNIQDLQAKYRDVEPEYQWEKQYKTKAMALSKKDAQRVVDVMNGDYTGKFQWNDVHQFAHGNSLWEHESVSLVNVMRLYGVYSRSNNDRGNNLAWGPLRLWLGRRDGLTDLRQLQDVLQHLGWPEKHLDTEILNNWQPSFLFNHLPKEGIWPYFASHMPVLQAGLTEAGTSNWEGVNFERVLDVIECFPVVPVALRAGLLQLALGDGKRYRLRIQNILSSITDIDEQVKLALSSNAQSARVNAARWLARIGSVGSIEPLKKALKKEKREVARAALMSALEALGEDISEYVAPQVLLQEAQKGLGKAMPKGLEWFPFTALPALRWRDGSAMDASIPTWWIVLACKMKEPKTNDLLIKYLEQLDEASRGTLGMFVLRAFIEQDTRSPSLEEATAQAKKDAPQLFGYWQQWAKSDWGKEYRNRTLQDAENQIRQEVLASYLGSAIKEKGIVALCAYCPGAEAVPVVQAYMKKHYIRRAQIEAILTALSCGNDNNVIQLLLSVARRYRTRSVQETAKELVNDIAERNHWTHEELADRTMPTAGFDATGKLELDYGSRQFVVQLDQQLKPVLTNDSGKTIKSLPAARQNDDPELVKESKSLFSNCKKELKQVVQLTTGRLYEAMCANRRWPATDWNTYLFEHPVAIHLIQNLVWAVEHNGEVNWMRPTTDGALLNLDDDEIDLPQDSEVYLAHRSIMDEENARAWASHLKDYKIKPLFDQLGRPTVPEDQDMYASTLETYKGFMSDAFTLRGAFTKLGYQRGQPEDGGFFMYYYKDFNSLGLKAVINFSGNCVPEENVAAALLEMGICKLDTQSWYFEGNYLPLKDIPKILLSEVMADYKAVADKTSGFDPQWEKRIPW
jgi:hypothetical protein